MRKWLKPEIWLIASGVLLALAVTVIILSISVFSVGINMVHTELEASAMKWTELFLFDSDFQNSYGFFILCIALLLYCIFLVRCINSEFNFKKLISLRGALLWLLAVCFVLISICTPFTTELVPFNLMKYDFLWSLELLSYFGVLRLADFSIPIFGFAIVWLISGVGRQPSGWKTRSYDALRGMTVGSGVSLLGFFQEFSVAIIAYSYNVDHGPPYELNPYVMKITTVVYLLGILGITVGSVGTAMAFSFRDFTYKIRIKWFGVPVVICLALFSFVGFVYFR